MSANAQQCVFVIIKIIYCVCASLNNNHREASVTPFLSSLFFLFSRYFVVLWREEETKKTSVGRGERERETRSSRKIASVLIIVLIITSSRSFFFYFYFPLHLFPFLSFFYSTAFLNAFAVVLFIKKKFSEKIKKCCRHFFFVCKHTGHRHWYREQWTFYFLRSRSSTTTTTTCVLDTNAFLLTCSHIIIIKMYSIQ